MSAVNSGGWGGGGGGVGAKKRPTLQTNQHWWKVHHYSNFIPSVVCICNLYLIFGTLL